MSGTIPLLVILGPTATGKSDLALSLAQDLNGEIISADSAQVYRGLDIGTAKPSHGDRRLVPHHLIDVVTPERRFNVAEFQQMTDAVAAQIYRRNRLPILAGGTGLYIRAVIERFAFLPGGEDPSFRQHLYARARAEGSEILHRELLALDASAAKGIHPQDTRRIVRALERVQKHRLPPARFSHREPTSPYLPWVLGLSVERSRLYRRINRRTQLQLAAGWVAEVRHLLQCFPPSAPAFQVLGYRELCAHVRDGIAMDTVAGEIQQKTRNYARRQLTWFRRERVDRWLDVTGGIGARRYRALRDEVQRLFEAKRA